MIQLIENNNKKVTKFVSVCLPRVWCTYSEAVLLSGMFELMILAGSTGEETLLAQVIVETLEATISTTH